MIPRTKSSNAKKDSLSKSFLKSFEYSLIGIYIGIVSYLFLDAIFFGGGRSLFQIASILITWVPLSIIIGLFIASLSVTYKFFIEPKFQGKDKFFNDYENSKLV